MFWLVLVFSRMIKPLQSPPIHHWVGTKRATTLL
jgi:hypothetical protein